MNNKKLKKYSKLKTKKQKWLELFQLVGEYVHLMKQDFQTSHENGDFLTEHIFDSAGPKAMRQASRALLSMVWKNASESMRIYPHPDIPNNPEVKEYFEYFDRTASAAMDDVKAGMAIALEEYMDDQMSFGTSGLGVFKGEGSDLLFKSLGIQECYIDEGPNGFVDTVYICREYTIENAVAEFGVDNISKDARRAFEGGNGDRKIKILHAIEPRKGHDKDSQDAESMPVSSCHIELDTKHEIKNSGYNEMPYYVSRFYKKKNEAYGRSPAMDALPDILEINNLKEARSVGIEKKLDPPLGVMNDAIAGNAQIDTSARGINVMNPKGRVSGPSAIFPLYSVGDIREADKGIEDLTLSIKEHFLLDKFLDLQSQVEMTLGEFTERQKQTALAMGGIFSRVIREVIQPIIERSVAILWREKKLGMWNIENGVLVSDEIPKEVIEFIATGEEFYKIEYMTPAAKIMQAAEAQGILRTWEFAGQVSQSKPEVMDMLDADESLKIMSQIVGANSKILISDDKVKQIREARVQQQQQQQQMQMAMMAAEQGKNAETTQ